MRKKDIIAAFIIGEACALIFLLILKFLEPPLVIIKLANFFPFILPVLSILGTFFISLFEKKAPTFFQAGKSFLVGILNTFIDLGILNFLMWFFQITSGSIYTLFKGISFSVSVVNSYFWNKFWTFEKRESKLLTKEFFQFFIIATGGLLIHLFVASLVVNIIGPQFGIRPEIWANVGAISAVFFGFLWNFLGYKFIVFRK
jgi:putative flippase GtrA